MRQAVSSPLNFFAPSGRGFSDNEFIFSTILLLYGVGILFNSFCADFFIRIWYTNYIFPSFFICSFTSSHGTVSSLRLISIAIIS